MDKRELDYRHFISSTLMVEIINGVELCFDDVDTDPEVSWDMFRSGLRKIKKKHKELYNEYLETDELNQEG